MKPLCLALALLTGCSWTMVSGPHTVRGPDNRPSYPRCTTSIAWPIVDGVFTALFVAIAVTAITNPRERMEGDPSQANEVATAAVIAGLWGTSGFIGVRRISRCHTAREEFAKYPNGVPPGAPSYRAPYAPPIEVPYSGPPATTPPPQPAATQPAPAALGTEGDVCASTAECSTGLTCTNNVCIRPPATR